MALNGVVSRAFFIEKKKILARSKIPKLKECIEHAVHGVYFIMGITSTTMNESIHYLHTRICPKDIHAPNVYEGRMGLTVLNYNFGRYEALKQMEECFKLKIPQKFFDQAISFDNQQFSKRERDITFSKEFFLSRREKKKQKKTQEEEYKKSILKYDRYILYGEDPNAIGNDETRKDLLFSVDSMKVVELNSRLILFNCMKLIKNWKKWKKPEKQKMLKLLLEKGEGVALLENPQLFKN